MLARVHDFAELLNLVCSQVEALAHLIHVSLTELTEAIGPLAHFRWRGRGGAVGIEAKAQASD
jgi:hypothetical protein